MEDETSVHTDKGRESGLPQDTVATRSKGTEPCQTLVCQEVEGRYKLPPCTHDTEKISCAQVLGPRAESRCGTESGNQGVTAGREEVD